PASCMRATTRARSPSSTGEAVSAIAPREHIALINTTIAKTRVLLAERRRAGVLANTGDRPIDIFAQSLTEFSSDE
ncbi:MAG: hypothetical protein ABI056_04765, partial [Caulobacteraceae bacterium]